MIEVYYENPVRVMKYKVNGVIVTNDTITLIGKTEEITIIRVEDDSVQVKIIHETITDEEVKGKQA